MAVDGARALEPVEQVGLVEHEDLGLLARADLLEHVVDRAHHRAISSSPALASTTWRISVGVPRLLERRGERVDELMGQLADEADGVAEQVGAPGDLQRACRRVERLEERSATATSAPVSAFISVDLPALV